jgi:transcriptional regulator with XRE-family HTH domain
MTVMVRQKFALRHVPAWLRYREMTRKQLAADLNTTEATVSRWINGQNAMKVEDMQRLGEVLGLPREMLCFPPPRPEREDLLVEVSHIMARMPPDRLGRWIEIGHDLTPPETELHESDE